MGQIKKNKVLYYIKYSPFSIGSNMYYLFTWPILDARAEIFQKISVPFGAMEFQEKNLLRFNDLYVPDKVAMTF